MKKNKGEAGYLNAKTKQAVLKTILEFAVVFLIFAVGYITTKTRLNLLTVAAVLGCLPASRALVSVIMLAPRKGMEQEKAEKVQSCAKNLTVIYDMVITSYEKVFPIDCIVIYDHIVCGYTKNEKTDENYASSYIKKMLLQNNYDKITVKIFKDYQAFLNRTEAIASMAESSKDRNKKQEDKMKDIILSLSM